MAKKKPKPPKKPSLPAHVQDDVPPWLQGGADAFDHEKYQDWSYLKEPKRRRIETFIIEYIKDFNGGAAARRMGYSEGAVYKTASIILKEPYAQYFLDKTMREAKDESLITRGIIIGGLVREANHYGLDGGSAARTSALRALAKIKGMEIQKVEGTVNVTGGVMAVPLASSLEEWEAISVAAQQRLKEKVRE